MVFISGSRVTSGPRVISFLGSWVLRFSGSRVFGFLGFWVLGLSSSGEPCCTLKLNCNRKIIKKFEKKMKKKLDFFFLDYFTWPGLPENTRNIRILGRVRAGRVWPISWSGSSGPEF